MASWYHVSNPEWLKARCNYLTASDVIALWPETATGIKRKLTDDSYMAIAFKQREFDPTAAVSYSHAARGHILEPYCVEEHNLQRPRAKALYHWDNCVLHNGGLIAFSPDALDVPQLDTGQVTCHINELVDDISVVGEIKSYGGDKHFATYSQGQKAIERIQIAVGMYVCIHAKAAKLLLYNPRMEKGALLCTVWQRNELEKELGIIDDIATKFAEVVYELENATLPVRLGKSEEEILEEVHALELMDHGQQV